MELILNQHETERLIFRPIRREDADAFLSYFRSPQAIEFMGFELNNEEQCHNWIQRVIERYEMRPYGLMGLERKADGQLVGMCGFLEQVVDEVDELEIGYHLLPEHWGNGYATEAATACRNFAEQKKLAESIISIIHVDNVRSQRVAERNEMKREKQTVYREWPVYIYRYCVVRNA